MIGNHKEKILVFVAKGDSNSSRPLMLRLPWMEKYDVVIRPKVRALAFSPNSCPESCLPTTEKETVYCVKK